MNHGELFAFMKSGLENVKDRDKVREKERERELERKQQQKLIFYEFAFLCKIRVLLGTNCVQ